MDRINPENVSDHGDGHYGWTFGEVEFRCINKLRAANEAKTNGGES
ncbi:MAG: hypothetical protein AAFU85_33755 [Planctomycetota bacterium]